MAQKRNILIDQGTNFSKEIDILDSNNDAFSVSGYTANAQLRKHYASNSYVEFSTSVGSTSVTISLTPDQTANMTPGRYMWDLKIISSSNNVIRVVEGIATLTPQISK